MIDLCRFGLWNTHPRVVTVNSHMNIALWRQFYCKKGTFTGHSPKTLDVDVCASDWSWSPNRQHLLNSFIQIDTRGSEKYRQHPFQLMHSVPQLPHKTPSRSCADHWSKVNPHTHIHTHWETHTLSHTHARTLPPAGSLLGIEEGAHSRRHNVGQTGRGAAGSVSAGASSGIG